jgi:hypothetical protein
LVLIPPKEVPPPESAAPDKGKIIPLVRKT